MIKIIFAYKYYTQFKYSTAKVYRCFLDRRDKKRVVNICLSYFNRNITAVNKHVEVYHLK